MTAGERIRILNVEDEEVDHMALARIVKDRGLPYEIDRAATLAEALKLLSINGYDIVLIDYMMPDGTGLELLGKIKGAPSLFISGSGDENVAVRAMKGGAYDYIMKDPSGAYLELLPTTIDKVLHTFYLEQKRKWAEEELHRSFGQLAHYKNELEGAYNKLKESEERLVQSAKMASLGEMGAGIAHELNSPLAGILSITEVVMRRIKKSDPNYPLLEKAKEAAIRSKYIIKDLLTYSNPSSYDFRPVLINETVRSTLSLFLSELKTRQIELVEDLEPALPQVFGNKGQLMEVIFNIIRNARDAVEGRGRISIRTRTVYREKGEGWGAWVAIEISDTGAGIPGEIKDRIFDPFFTTKEKGGGLNIGLGLSICQGIVKAHKGLIELESIRGKGTVFRVLLPPMEMKDL
jgi:signal transduction histidine kinase